jgi:Uma2 family endonuclease
MVASLFDPLYGYVRDKDLGVVLFAPLPVQLWAGKFREPDIVFMAAEHADRLGEKFWRGADLVMEVVSPDDPERDNVIKRLEYAQAGIPEYWIVDPIEASVSVLSLEGSEYFLHGKFVPGETAKSVLLDGFTVDVATVLAEAN